MVINSEWFFTFTERSTVCDIFYLLDQYMAVFHQNGQYGVTFHTEDQRLQGLPDLSPKKRSLNSHEYG